MVCIICTSVSGGDNRCASFVVAACLHLDVHCYILSGL